jgi:hypothetical protein
MFVNLATTGNAIYQSIKDDALAIAKIKTEAKNLALSIATDPEASNQITSATVNGQSFSTTSSMTQLQRLQLLRWVIKCSDNCGAISKTQISIF